LLLERLLALADESLATSSALAVAELR